MNCVAIFLSLTNIAAAVGLPEETLELDAGMNTDDLLQLLAGRYPGLLRLLPRCGIAQNGEYVHGGARELCNGDEIALIPPVSGG